MRQPTIPIASPLVIHIPHASRRIPFDIRSSIILSDFDLGKELTKITDAYTDDLFNVDFIGHDSVIFPISRLILDPERFLEDAEEIMAAKGMGVIYTHTSEGKWLRCPPTPKERVVLIDRYYHPHHKNFQGRVSDCMKALGHCVIIDAHSFPSEALPYEVDQSADRPDICIGTDEFHTPGWLSDMVCEEFEKLGYSTAINKPFYGTIVPTAYYHKDSSVKSIMIEINRRLYMDETTGVKNFRFNSVKQNISSILRKLQSEQTSYKRT